MNIRDPKKLTGITAFVLVITALIVIPMGIMSGRLGARWNGVSTALLILVFGFIALGAIAWIFSRILGGFVRRELWRGEYDEALRWMRRLGPAGDRK